MHVLPLLAATARMYLDPSDPAWSAPYCVFPY